MERLSLKGQHAFSGKRSGAYYNNKTLEYFLSNQSLHCIIWIVGFTKCELHLQPRFKVEG